MVGTRWLKNTTMWLVIKAVLQKDIPDIIPVAGSRATTTNLHVIYLSNKEDILCLLIREIDKNEVRGSWSIDGENFTKPGAVSISDLWSYTLYIEHHYHGWTFTTRGTPKFLLRHWTRWAFIQVKYDELIQSRFNKKKLVRLERMNMLNYMLTETRKQRDFETCPVRTLNDLYTTRWIKRPDEEELRNYYILLFESLKSSEDLIATKSSAYKLAPQALNTISAFELEEQRHRDNYTNQRRILWLTLGLIFVGLIQAFVTGYAAWHSTP